VHCVRRNKWTRRSGFIVCVIFEPIKSFMAIKVNSVEFSKKILLPFITIHSLKPFKWKCDFESIEIQVQTPHEGKCISPRNNDHIKTIGPRFEFTTRAKRIKGPWVCENHPNVNEFDEYERCADRKNQFISLSLSPLSVRNEGRGDLEETLCSLIIMRSPAKRAQVRSTSNYRLS
jgi:hypothetical protein